MGRMVKARPQGFGILGRAMNNKDPRFRAELLSGAADKLAEFRIANAHLASENNSLGTENSRLKMLLEGALKELASLKGLPWPPVIEQAPTWDLNSLDKVKEARIYIQDPENRKLYDPDAVVEIEKALDTAEEQLKAQA